MRFMHRDTVLCAIVVALASALYLSGFGGAFVLNSDIVMPYVMYSDVVAGEGLLSGWGMPESPYWFPDILITWAVYAGTPLLVAVTIFAFLQASAFLLLARWILLSMDPLRGRLAWLVFLLVWMLLLVIGMRSTDAWFDRFIHFVFVPYTHAGALVITLACLGLLLRLHRDPGGRAPLVMLIVLAVATVVSDRLYAVIGLLPILGVAALPILPARTRLRIGIATMLVLVGSELAQRAGGAGAMSSSGSGSARGDALAQMLDDFHAVISSSLIMSAIMLAGLAALIGSLVQVWRRRREVSSDADLGSVAATSVFITLSVVLPMAASVLLGRHSAMDSFRYGQTIVFLLLPLSWLLARMMAKADPRRASSVATALLVVVLIVGAATGDTSGRALREEWRAQADCMDEARRQYGLGNGLSRYWRANSLNAQLRSEGKVVAVTKDLESTSVNTNIDWIGVRAERADDMPRIDFIDGFQLDDDLLDATFGEPVARVACPLSTIRVYDAKAGLLAKLHRRNDWLPHDTLARHGRMAVPAATWTQDAAYVDGDGLHAAGDFPGETPVLLGGVETSGPVASVWFDYSLDRKLDADVRWEVVALDADGGMLGAVATGSLVATRDGRVARFDLPPPASAVHGLGVAIIVRGGVDLRMRALGLALDPPRAGSDPPGS